MHKKLQNLIDSLLSNQSFGSDHELYLFLILHAASFFVAFVHVLLAAAYLLSRITVLWVVSLAGVALYGPCLALLKRQLYAPTGLLISCSVSGYALLSVHYIGADTYVIFYFLLVLLMQLIIPYAKLWVRGLTVFGVWLCCTATIWVGLRGTPVYAVGRFAHGLSLLNFNILFVGTVVELSIGNILHQVIRHYNQTQMETLAFQANSDPLTGLYNRRYADLIFEKIRQDPTTSWCVALVDIDDFKQINDCYGHDAGDGVLTILSDMMRSALRKTDAVVRWGGEEFLLLLAGVELETAIGILDDLRESISKAPMAAGGVLLRVTVTIGVEAVCRKEIGESIMRCDSKLYQGKRQGKNRVVA